MDHIEERAAELVSPPTRLVNRAWVWQTAALAILIVFLYHEIVARMFRNWWEDPNFSHGFLIPLFSGFLIWRQWKQLAQIPVSPSWTGIIVVAGSLNILVVGVLGVEMFLSRSSLVFLAAGLVILFLGWNHFKAILFPWAFLFLMIPIPVIIFNQAAFPLQLLASQFASGLLELLGVPVLREGNVIHLPAMPLEVAEACSGIRSLMSLVALAVIYGYLLEPKISRRMVLAGAAVPIAVVANGLRVVGTGLLVYWWDPEKALGFFHTFSGWLIFIVSLAMLFGLHGAVRFISRWRMAGKP